MMAGMRFADMAMPDTDDPDIPHNQEAGMSQAIPQNQEAAGMGLATPYNPDAAGMRLVVPRMQKAENSLSIPYRGSFPTVSRYMYSDNHELSIAYARLTCVRTRCQFARAHAQRDAWSARKKDGAGISSAHEQAFSRSLGVASTACGRPHMGHTNR